MHWIWVKFYEMGDTKKGISSSSCRLNLVLTVDVRERFQHVPEVQMISYKRYTHSMETIYLPLVHTGSFFMKSPVPKIILNLFPIQN